MQLYDCRYLVTRNDAELARVGIAAMNLACAAGLPDTHELNVRHADVVLNDWTEKVRWQTVRHWRQFERSPAEYHHSRSYFRALALVTTLQRDCGVRYAPDKIDDDASFHSQDVFLHGLVAGAGGTCATMPVLYVEIGRRLGYPLSLVKAIGTRFTHLFVRWDDDALDGARFNIEATAKGMSCHPDSYYRTGRYQFSEELERRTCLLKSQSRRQELACFINERACRWMDFREYRRAAECFAWACALMPGDILQLRSMERLMDAWWSRLREAIPVGFPPLTIHFSTRRYPRSLPELIERDIIHLETLEAVLADEECKRQWWEPMRRGQISQKLGGIEANYANSEARIRFHVKSHLEQASIL